MQVPGYKREAGSNDLPAARQVVNTADYHFYGATQTALADQAAQAGGQLREALARIQARQQQEADAARVQDAQNRTQTAINGLLYGGDGVLNKQGAAVFEAQANNKSATANTLEALDRHIGGLAADLGNDGQRRQYLDWAQAARRHVGDLLVQHEGQQLRVYQRGVGQAAIAANQQSMALNYNDPGLLQGGVEAIGQAAVKLARLEGYPDEYGATQALKHNGDALSAAIQAALTHNDDQTAADILQRFSAHMDSDALLHNYQLISKAADKNTARAVAGQVMAHIMPDGGGASERLSRIALGAAPPPEQAAELQNLLRDFHGDLAQTLAAAHAGAEATRQALEQARRQGGQWLGLLPAATQRYVQSRLQAFNAGQGAAKPPGKAAAEALAMAALPADAAPYLRKQVLAELDSRYRLQTQALKQRRLQGRADAMRVLTQNGGRYADVPADIMAGVAAKDHERLLNFARTLANAAPVATDWGLYYRLRNEPDLLKDSRLMAWRDRLNDTEYHQLLKQQQKLRQGQADQAGPPVRDFVERLMSEAGVNPRPAYTDPAGMRAAGRVWSAFQLRLDAAEQAQGKPLNDEAMRKLAAELFTRVGVRAILSGRSE
jgi:soluble lytic murein transglycosylase